MKKVIKNCNEIEQDDDLDDLIFECCRCGFKSEDEDDLNICDECNNYVCQECSIYIEHQGYQETVCSNKCR